MSNTSITLSPTQQSAIEHGDGPLLIVAGAGTGKTLVITHRIAHLINSKMAMPNEILALTFTEKAASEMAERIDLLLPYGFANVQISTFHAFGDQILREFGLELGLNPDMQVLSQPEQVIFFREHLFDLPLKHYRPLSDPTRFIQAMLNVISRAKDEDVTPEDYQHYVNDLKLDLPNHIEDAGFLDELEKQEEITLTYAAYQNMLGQQGKLDFGDQVALVLKLFRQHPAILRKVQSRYKYILVDEFQDTNYAQFQLIQLVGGDSGNITVVGDDDQSIYKFRGAAISNILTFMDIYPKANQVVLTENFRSTQVILDTAYRLIAHNNPDRLEVKNNISKKLISSIGEGPLVEHLYCDTLTTESDRVAEIIMDLVKNKVYRFGDIAILVRSNNSATPFLQALNMKEIPWRFTGNRGLYARSEIKLLLSFLRVLSDPADTISLYHLISSEVYELQSMEDINRCLSVARKENQELITVLNQPDRFESLEDLSADTVSTIPKILQDIDRYRELSRDNLTGVVLYQFLHQSNYLKKLTRQETLQNHVKIQNIAKFFDVVWSFSQVAREDRVVHFVQYLDLMIEAGDDPGTAEADPDEDAVQVMTVHKAKGLEWPVVFMVSLLYNKFPSVRRKDPIELPERLVKEVMPQGDSHQQEERRLFYVGMTRAKERLYLTGAVDYGGVRKQKVSPFVLEALDRPTLEDVSVKSSPMQKIDRFAPPPEGLEQTLAPIPEESVINLSHYQVDDYQTCPLKYKYVHILRLPFIHHTIVYGKAVHQAVETYFRHKITNRDVQLGDLYEAYQSAWRSVGFISREHEAQRFEAGKLAIQRFFETHEKTGIIPKHIEEKFSFLVGRNRIAGRWDRIDDRDGHIVIVDYKTSAVHQQEIADKQTRKSLQLAIYAMAYQKIYGRYPDWVELHFLESGLVGKSDVVEKQIEKNRKIIDNAALGIRARDYSPKPSYQSCKYCAFIDICPSAAR